MAALDHTSKTTRSLPTELCGVGVPFLTLFSLLQTTSKFGIVIPIGVHKVVEILKLKSLELPWNRQLGGGGGRATVVVCIPVGRFRGSIRNPRSICGIQTAFRITAGAVACVKLFRRTRNVDTLDDNFSNRLKSSLSGCASRSTRFFNASRRESLARSWRRTILS